ncbi:Cation/multidrug efflux pump [Candidatus Regiella insecticola 5.15]|uniref:Cation/multidrug efflux pump n=1 Tax=Candidatus Regiella insecticola 5.15 TaxID=1005043 RepID=G2GY26_9ENTR|nr:Cation/multidrug efflux pump [Candidatus Regiella insecticola 5.15]
MTNFFIDRPIFAWVIAIMIMLVGSAAIMILPIAQYPTVAPPPLAYPPIIKGLMRRPYKIQ